MDYETGDFLKCETQIGRNFVRFLKMSGNLHVMILAVTKFFSAPFSVEYLTRPEFSVFGQKFM